MGQDDLVPFSSLIAGMLLIKRSVGSIEVVNVLSRIIDAGIIIDDENDDIDCLFPCMELDTKCCFYLNENLSYETMLFPNISVRDFLMQHTNERILSFLANDDVYKEFYRNQFSPLLDEVSLDFNLSQDTLKNSSVLNQAKKKVRRKTFKIIPCCIFLGDFF